MRALVRHDRTVAAVRGARAHPAGIGAWHHRRHGGDPRHALPARAGRAPSPSTATSTASRARPTPPRRSGSTRRWWRRRSWPQLDDGFAFALVPGDRELSLRGLARAAGSRSAALASERDAQRLTGYQIGGISPFGSRTALPVYAVAEWLARERVALNGGARGVIVELAGADVVRLLSPIADRGVASSRCTSPSTPCSRRATAGRARSGGCRTSRRPRASTSRSSGSPGTPARPSARARASAPRRCARPRRCCGPTTRRRT